MSKPTNNLHNILLDILIALFYSKNNYDKRLNNYLLSQYIISFNIKIC